MAQVNATPMTGGTSKLLNLNADSAFANVINQNVYLYYKVIGTSGDKSVVSIGAYLEARVKIYCDQNYTPPAQVQHRFGRDSKLKMSVAGVGDYYIFNYTDHTDVTGYLIEYNIQADRGANGAYGPGFDEGFDYDLHYHACYATYRYWMKDVSAPWPELALSSIETTKIFFDWSYTSWLTNVLPIRDSDSIYLSFNNMPYLESYPTQVYDSDGGFYVRYVVPEPELMDFIQFGILDAGGNLLIGYKLAQNAANSFYFSFTQQELENLWWNYYTVSTINAQFAVRFRNLDGDTVLVTHPILFEITPTKPTISYGIVDKNDVTIAATGDRLKLIRYQSNAEVSATATAYKQAIIIDSYIAQGNNKVTDKNPVVFSNVEGNVFTLYVKDSRGNSTLETVTVPMVNYFPLTCNLAAGTPTTDDKIRISLSGKYWDGNFGVEDNYIAFRYKYTSNIDGNETDWTSVSNPNVSLNQDSYNAYFDIPVPNHVDTYTVQVEARDFFNNVVSNSVTVKSTPVFDWGQDDFRFNVPVAINGNLTVTGTINGGGITDEYVNPAQDYIVEQGTKTTGSGNSAANWVYRKWNSGVAECWCRKHVSTAVNTAWGNLFVSGALSYTNITWGVDFADIPVANITIAPNASGAFLIAGGSTSLTKTNTGGYEIARGSALASAGNFYINYYGIGKWK